MAFVIRQRAWSSSTVFCSALLAALALAAFIASPHNGMRIISTQSHLRIGGTSRSTPPHRRCSPPAAARRVATTLAVKGDLVLVAKFAQVQDQMHLRTRLLCLSTHISTNLSIRCATALLPPCRCRRQPLY